MEKIYGKNLIMKKPKYINYLGLYYFT